MGATSKERGRTRARRHGGTPKFRFAMKLCNSRKAKPT